MDGRFFNEVEWATFGCEKLRGSTEAVVCREKYPRVSGHQDG